MNLYQKLVEIRKAVPYLQKENDGFQYKFVSSSQTLAAVRQKMDELGVMLIPKVTGTEVREIVRDKTDRSGNVTGKTYEYFTELEIEMAWVNAEDPSEIIVCPWYGQGVDTGEKGVGKALTYAEKYFMLKTFNIATDKDDPDAFQKKVEGPIAEADARQIYKSCTETYKMSTEQIKPFVSTVIGHSIKSANDLTNTEAKQVLKTLGSATSVKKILDSFKSAEAA